MATDPTSRLAHYDELLRRFAASVRASQLYKSDHPLLTKNVDGLLAALKPLLQQQPAVTVGVVEQEFVVSDTPIPKAGGAMKELIDRLRANQAERISFERGVTPEGVVQLISGIAALSAKGPADANRTWNIGERLHPDHGSGAGPGHRGTSPREFGLSALMHDIGKVRTPQEILNKPDRLTEQEFVVMRRHPVEGAEILRRTPEMPILAPVVAFEHHLRLDGSGYPHGAKRSMLNLATMLCSIADVYDAMRSQRAYQQAFPSDRVLAVLRQDDGTHFEKHLVRRFVQLLGIHPPGTIVELSTDEIAVVMKVHAPDPHRPRVKILMTADGRRHDVPFERNLWENHGAQGTLHGVAPSRENEYTRASAGRPSPEPIDARFGAARLGYILRECRASGISVSAYR